MQMYKEGCSNLRISNSTFNIFHPRILQKTQNFKINNHQPPHQSLPKTSQEPPITTVNTQIPNNPQSSSRISYQDNPYTFEERHARLSEPLAPVIRQASLSESQYEPVYNIYPPLQQDLKRARHQCQNENTLEINRQIVHPRQNRNLQNPRVQFNIPHSPKQTS